MTDIAALPKVVHKVLGELRLKMAKDMQLPPSTEFAWVWVVNRRTAAPPAAC